MQHQAFLCSTSCRVNYTPPRLFQLRKMAVRGMKEPFLSLLCGLKLNLVPADYQNELGLEHKDWINLKHLIDFSPRWAK